jgi:hypothetical protein
MMKGITPQQFRQQEGQIQMLTVVRQPYHDQDFAQREQSHLIQQVI